MNLEHFKKVSQDGKCAVLKHPDGHEIKIAISALNGAMKKQLHEMPLHQAEGSKEEIEAPNEDVVKEEVNTPSEQTSVTETAPAAQPQQPAPQQATPAQPQSSGQQAANSLNEPLTEPQTPVKNTPEQEAANNIQEQLHFAQDLGYGKIQPKTYRDLYDDKSTLGKIGTLFGIMASGIGSSLTHQPSAIMAMMDKQIQNDLEAQKQNQSNKQNWYKLSLEESATDSMNQLRDSEAYNKMAEGDKKVAVNQMLGIAQKEGTIKAKYRSRFGSIGMAQDIVNRMPDGPAKQAQQAIVNQMVHGAMMGMNEDFTHIANEKHNFLNNLGQNKQPYNPVPTKGPADPNQNYSAVNQNKLSAAVQKGKLAPEAQDAIPPDKVGAVLDEQGKLETHRQRYANHARAFKLLADMKNTGQIPSAKAIEGVLTALGGLAGGVAGGAGGTAAGPAGTAVAATAGAGIGAKVGDILGKGAAHTVEGVFGRLRDAIEAPIVANMGKEKGLEERQRDADAMLPTWKDTAETLPQVHKEMTQYYASQPEEQSPTLKLYGLKEPFPQYDNKFGKPNTTAQRVADVGKKAKSVVSNGDKGILQNIADTFKSITNPSSVAKEKEK